jgi:hypothetical protein
MMQRRMGDFSGELLGSSSESASEGLCDSFAESASEASSGSGSESLGDASSSSSPGPRRPGERKGLDPSVTDLRDIPPR